MSRYLNHLAALTLNQVESVQPRLAGRFEASGEGEDIGLPNTGENQGMKGEALFTMRTPDITERQAPTDILIRSVAPTFLQGKTQVDGGQKQGNLAKPAASVHKAPKVPDAQTEFAWPPMGLGNPNPIKMQTKPVQPAKPTEQAAQNTRATPSLNTIERSQERLIDTTRREFVVKETVANNSFQEVKHWEDVQRSAPIKPARIVSRSEQIAEAPPAPAPSATQAASTAEPDESIAPTIQVTIGRIEIRATQTTDKPTAKPRAASTTMSLDDYLKQRNGGKS